jgi:hypothetical protein
MYRIFVVTGLACITFGGAYAGTVVPINLAQQQGGSSACTSTTNSCTPPTVTSTAVGFENTLFSAFVPSDPNGSPSNVASTPPDGPGSYIPGAQASNGDDAFQYFLAGSGKQGADSLLIDLGSCGGASGFSTLASGSCGLANADYLYTMIQGGNSYGTPGITVTVLGVNASGAQSESFTLIAGVDYRITNSTQSGANCTAANTVTAGTCAGSTDTSVASATDPNNSNITVFNNVYGPQTQGGNDYYADVQQLSLGSLFQGGDIDQVLIQYTSQNSGLKALTLSGLSVDETPEPGTIVMLGIGVGLIGLWKIRSQRAKPPASM